MDENDEIVFSYNLEHLWVGSSGQKRCFIWINETPELRFEEDSR